MKVIQDVCPVCGRMKHPKGFVCSRCIQDASSADRENMKDIQARRERCSHALTSTILGSAYTRCHTCWEVFADDPPPAAAPVTAEVIHAQRGSRGGRVEPMCGVPLVRGHRLRTGGAFVAGLVNCQACREGLRKNYVEPYYNDSAPAPAATTPAQTSAPVTTDPRETPKANAPRKDASALGWAQAAPFKRHWGISVGLDDQTEPP